MVIKSHTWGHSDSSSLSLEPRVGHAAASELAFINQWQYMDMWCIQSQWLLWYCGSIWWIVPNLPFEPWDILLLWIEAFYTGSKISTVRCCCRCLSRIGWADMATFLLPTHGQVNCRPKMGLREPSVSCRDLAGSRKPGCSVTIRTEWASHVQVSRGASGWFLSHSWSSCLSDEDTIKLMTTPRCSLPDIVGSENLLRRRRRRRKRYALSGLKWHKTDLTWRCVSCHVTKQLHLLPVNHRLVGTLNQT